METFLIPTLVEWKERRAARALLTGQDPNAPANENEDDDDEEEDDGEGDRVDDDGSSSEKKGGGVGEGGENGKGFGDDGARLPSNT